MNLGEIRSIALSPDGSKFGSGGEDRRVVVWGISSQ